MAEIGIGHSFRTGAATERGKEAVLGTAVMLLGENSRTVSMAVGERLDEIGEKLPDGVVIRLAL